MRHIHYHKLLKFIVILICCISYSCDPIYFVTVTNNSDYEISVVDPQENITNYTKYPDTIPPFIYRSKGRICNIEPGQNGYIGNFDLSPLGLTYIMDKQNVDTISIFFFRSDDIDSLGYKEVSKRNMVLQRYDLTRKQAKKNRR